MNLILIVVTLSLDSAVVKPTDIKGLLKWKLLEADMQYSLPINDHSGWGARYELLEFNYTFTKPKIGLGTAFFEFWGYESSSTGHHSILPIEMKILIWYDKVGLFDSPFVPMFNGYLHINVLPIPAYGSDLTLDAGLEYTPGLLMNIRAGYVMVPRINYSAFYISAGMFLGAVHRIW